MSDQPDNSEPDDRGQPPADPNEFGKWLVDRATGDDKDDDPKDDATGVAQPHETDKP